MVALQWSNGADAIVRAAAKRFDAVVLDLAMPGMDGLETLGRLRADYPDLQVILLSGQATVRAAVEATRLGAVDVFEKPTDIDTLLAKIREARVRRLSLDDRRTAEEIDRIMHTKGW